MFPILSVTLFTPLVGALLILVIPREDERTIRRLGTAFAFITLALAVIIWANVVQSGSGMQMEENYPWVETFDVWYHLGVDGLSAPLIFLTALLTTLVTFYSSYAIDERVKEYYILFLLLEMGMTGVLLALDLVLFYVFWEIGLVPMFLLIGVWGDERRLYASRKFFLYNLVGGVAMLLAIIGVYFQTGTFNNKNRM
jgi:NADH-quinone oxidoreductase subunit M